MKYNILILLTSLALAYGCKKDSFITSADANVVISVDTVKFDTVFVNTGSITQSFKIFNANDQRLKINSIKIAGGLSSSYNINADGSPGPIVNDIELAPNDSMYVFVQVRIDPTSATLPFIIRDSIIINYNQVEKKVQLESYGRNAHFYRNRQVSGSETWNNDLPYVILGSLRVNSGATLTINKGVRVYVHADAPLLIDGSLQVNGQKDSIDRVLFAGDRLDKPYADYPAAWPGIYFTATSTNNILNYSVIKNAYQAIAIEGANVNPKLVLNQCIIDNAYDAGIIAINSTVRAVNCLISNCGKNLILTGGGTYDFTHCTIASYSGNFIDRKEPVLDISNSYNNVTGALTANFRNNIIYGESGRVKDEVRITKTGTGTFTINFINNLWKVETVPSNITSLVQAINELPQFDSIDASRNYFDFRLTKYQSPALNKGVATTVMIDLDGKPRPVGLPDLGCFEK